MKTIFTLFIICLFSYSSFAQPGTLDSSFGESGLVLRSFNQPPTLFYKGLLLPDDKIIEVGYMGPALGAVRYNADGSIDEGFGKSGITLVNFPELASIAYNVAQQTDGKLLLTGSGIEGFMESAIYHGLIVRLKQDGSLDSSFGVNGVIERTTPHRYTAGFGAISVLPDNSFIVYGNSDGSTYINKFTKDGILDESFGENGYVYFNFNFAVNTCKTQLDGKIVLAGTYRATGVAQFFLKRFLPDGSVDEFFGTDGTLITTNGFIEDYMNDMAFQSDGKIVVTGTESYSAMVNRRYTTDGKLDSTFGINGKLLITVPGTGLFGAGIAVTNNNQIILGGTTVSTNVLTANYAIFRLSSDGIIDSSFGNSGITTTDFSVGLQDQVMAIGLQKSGKIVAIGISTNNDNTYSYYSSAARYDNSLSKKQSIIKKIKHYAGTHNNVEAMLLNSVSIYPNPAQNVLHIAGLSSSNQTKLTVIDFMGNVKLQTVANTSAYNLNIAALTPGNYLLKIEMNDEVVTKKFVKE